MDELTLFRKALFELLDENEKWIKNVNIFLSWNTHQQEWWIKRIKDQASKGIPVAEQVMRKVVEIRLRGSNGFQP